MATKTRKTITKLSADEVLIRARSYYEGGELCAGPLAAFERKDGRYLPRANVLAEVLGGVRVSIYLSSTKQCAHCGQEMLFADYPRNEQPAVCSTKCLRERELQRQRLKAAASYTARASEPRTMACVTCGASFAARRSDARYCSVRCRVTAHRRNG